MPERAISTNDLPKAQLAYNWEFDKSAYQSLQEERLFLQPGEYQRRRDQLNARTAENLKSEIRERFFTLEYQTSYTLKEGKLTHILHDEPFEEIIKRGIEYRKAHGSTDVVREEAELIGFRKTEAILRDDDGPKTIVVISPRGHARSIYKMNFFDVFQKEDDGQVKMSRFTSTASLEKFWEAAQRLDPQIPKPIHLSEDYFLAHPIKTSLLLEEILQTIEVDEKALAKDYAESIIENCMPVILAYVNNPSEAGYRATVNLADILADKKTLPNFQFNDSAIERLSDSLSFRSTINYQLSTINYLASLPVRPVQTGCGLSGLTGIESVQTFSKLGAWSVADFGRGSLEEDKGDFDCPRCGHNITYGAGITECPGCGLEATCA